MVAVSLISNMPDTLLYILQLIVFAVASLLHGLTGMGFPMIGTIALAMLFPLPKAIAIMAFPSLIMNFIVLFTNNTRGVLGEVAYYCKHPTNPLLRWHPAMRQQLIQILLSRQAS